MTRRMCQARRLRSSRPTTRRASRCATSIYIGLPARTSCTNWSSMTSKAHAVTIVEWPERAGDQLGLSLVSMSKSAIVGGFSRATSIGARDIVIAATPDAASARRLSRMRAAYEFFCDAPNRIAASRRLRVSYLQGDASTRSYARLHGWCQPAPPDGHAEAAGRTDHPGRQDLQRDRPSRRRCPPVRGDRIGAAHGRSCRTVHRYLRRGARPSTDRGLR